MKQKNMTKQVKELSETELRYLLDKKFKVMATQMLTRLGRRAGEIRENLNKEAENIKKETIRDEKIIENIKKETEMKKYNK